MPVLVHLETDVYMCEVIVRVQHCSQPLENTIIYT